MNGEPDQRGSRAPRRRTVIAALLALAVIVAAALAAWATDSLPGSGPDAPAAGTDRPPPTEQRAAAQATVTFDSSTQRPRNATIRCGGGRPAQATGAWAQNPRAACRALYAAAPVLTGRPVPTTEVCAEQVFGDERVLVRGRIADQSFQRSFTRTSTCEEARFEAIRVLVDPWYPVERSEFEPAPPAPAP